MFPVRTTPTARPKKPEPVCRRSSEGGYGGPHQGAAAHSRPGRTEARPVRSGGARELFSPAPAFGVSHPATTPMDPVGPRSPSDEPRAPEGRAFSGREYLGPGPGSAAPRARDPSGPMVPLDAPGPHPMIVPWARPMRPMGVAFQSQQLGAPPSPAVRTIDGVQPNRDVGPGSPGPSCPLRDATRGTGPAGRDRFRSQITGTSVPGARAPLRPTQAEFSAAPVRSGARVDPTRASCPPAAACPVGPRLQARRARRTCVRSGLAPGAGRRPGDPAAR